MTKTPPDFYINALESHDSRLNKEQIILSAAQEGNDEFFEGVRLCLDPMITFGIRQVPVRKGSPGPGFSWTAFKVHLQALVDRRITGNDARDLIQDIMDHCTDSQWNSWYRRILIKDLRCGVSEKTINKVVNKKWPHYAVPIFSCQLAHDSANHEAKVAGQKLVEVKLDGVRVITIVYPDGRVDQFSRNGKELLNFGHIKAQISVVAGTFVDPMVLDGEVMSSSFQDLMRQVHRKENVNAGDAVLHLFDIVPLADFERGLHEVPQLVRSQQLQDWFATVSDQLPNVRVLDNELIDLNTDQGRQRFNEINRQAIDGGYEGIMLKDIDAVYECDRTVSWLKKKPVISVDLVLTGVEEGTGKNLGRLGALVCEGRDQGRDIVVNVGSGLTDAQRDEFWKYRNDILGNVVEVLADAVTKNQDGTYSLRFPRFLRFRYDK